MPTIELQIHGIHYQATYTTKRKELGDFNVIVEKLKCTNLTNNLPLNKWQIEPYIKNEIQKPII